MILQAGFVFNRMDEPRKNAEKSINPEKMIDKLLKSGYSSKVQKF